MTTHILAVDDEDVVLASIAKALESDRSADYKVHTVRSVEEAHARLEADRFDLVITDLMMPGIDGMALLESVRERYEDQRIVMLTGYPTMGVARQAMHLGAMDFVAKPFTREELRTVVSRVLSEEA